MPTSTSSTSSSPSSTLNPTASSPSSAETLLQPEALQAQYERFVPRALAISAGDVEGFRADVIALLRNVRNGVQAVMPRLDEIRQALPQLRIEEIEELPAMTEALAYATTQVVSPVNARELSLIFQRVSPLRKHMLRVAEAFAFQGLVPVERVVAIRKGAGRVDTAKDAVALAGLFVEYQEAFAGKHPFTREQISAMAQDGAELIRGLTPRGVREKVTLPAGIAPREMRDRLYTMVVQNHKTLRRAAQYLWQDEVDRYVPKLHSRTFGPRASATPTAAPAEPSPTTPSPIPA